MMQRLFFNNQYFMEYIPIIKAKDKRDFKSQIKIIEPNTKWAQVSVMDGKFVPYYSWSEPKKLKKLETLLNIEVYLMVASPFRAMDEWLKAGVGRIIFHWESLKLNPREQIKKITIKAQKFKCPLGIAIYPSTSWKEIEQFLPGLDRVVFTGVSPRAPKQSFQEETLIKIKEFQKFHPRVIVEASGGITPDIIKKLIEINVQACVLDLAVFNSLVYNKNNKK